MPLTGDPQQNFRELYADNKKSGKAKGANGKARSKAQIAAIALSAARKQGGKVTPQHVVDRMKQRATQ